MNLERFVNRVETASQDIAFLPFSKAYLPNYMQWFTDPKVRRHLSSGTPITEEKITAWMENVTTLESMNYRIVVLKGTPIGHAGLKKIPEGRESGELGVVIGDNEARVNNIGLAVGVAARQYFFDTIPQLQSVAVLRSQGISGNRLLPLIGFENKGVIEEQGHKFDKYVLERQRWGQKPDSS